MTTGQYNLDLMSLIQLRQCVLLTRRHHRNSAFYERDDNILLEVWATIACHLDR